MQVVGLVDSAKYLFVNEKARPYVYFPLAQEPSTMTLSVVRGRVVSGVAASATAVDPRVLAFRRLPTRMPDDVVRTVIAIVSVSGFATKTTTTRFPSHALGSGSQAVHRSQDR